MRSRLIPKLLLAIVIAASLQTATRGAGPIQTPVHTPPPGSAAIKIAVLSDHYTSDTKFANDVENFIDHSLLAHPYYAAHANQLQVDRFYDVLLPGKLSNYGFNVHAPGQKCDLTWVNSSDPALDTAAQIFAIVKDFNPVHTIVIGDHDYNMGCTEGEWSYVARGSIGTNILPHEMGHALGRLYDEWVASDKLAASHPGIDLTSTRNCYDTRNGVPPPWTVASHWSFIPGAGSVGGCDLYGVDVVHGFDHMAAGHTYCLMAASGSAQFCPICTSYMNGRFAYEQDPNSDEFDKPWITERPPFRPNEPTNGTGQRPPGPPPSPTSVRIVKTAFQQPPPKLPPVAPGSIEKPAATRPIIRLLVAFDPAKGAITAKKGFAINSRYTPAYQRVGEYIYEISDGNRPPNARTIEVGVIPSNTYAARSYQGGVAHQTAPAQPTNITIQIPDVTAAMATAPDSAISIRIWWLPPSVGNTRITRAVFDDLRNAKRIEPRSEITPAQLRSVM